MKQSGPEEKPVLKVKPHSYQPSKAELEADMVLTPTRRGLRKLSAGGRPGDPLNRSPSRIGAVLASVKCHFGL